MWLLRVAIKAGRYEGNVYERRLIINILVESASAQTANLKCNEQSWRENGGRRVGRSLSP